MVKVTSLLASLVATAPYFFSAAVFADEQTGREPWTSDKHKILKHHGHPKHKVRVARHAGASMEPPVKIGKDDVFSQYCVGATPGYTGYLSTDNDTKHFYFAFFESRSNPLQDPVFMWLNGGPGCSSSTGLLSENGPCLLNAQGTNTTRNEYSWTEKASGFWVDQPLRVGFSYDDKPNRPVKDTFAASEDIYAFLSIWYHHFPQYQKLPFAIAGESYAAHYIPVFASHIVAQNRIATTQGRANDVIPLKSVLIGNGFFDPAVQDTAAYDIACANTLGKKQILSPQTCKEMQPYVARCQAGWDNCRKQKTFASCEAASTFCARYLKQPYEAQIRPDGYPNNPYDMTKPCIGQLCYPIEDKISAWFNNPKVRLAYHASPKVLEYKICSDTVYDSFADTGDDFTGTMAETTDLLNNGINVLIYAGVQDWICNYIGVERFLLAVPWRLRLQYQAATRMVRKWSGGEYWGVQNLRYVRVHGAGHMVPTDQPKAALDMFNSWVHNTPLV